MEKIISQENFYLNSTTYTSVVLENRKIIWFANTVLTNIPKSVSDNLEKEFQMEYVPLEKEVD